MPVPQPTSSTRSPEASASATRINLRGRTLMPGLVDTHVHLNDPGRADWEGFESGTRAAAASP